MNKNHFHTKVCPTNNKHITIQQTTTILNHTTNNNTTTQQHNNTTITILDPARMKLRPAH